MDYNDQQLSQEERQKRVYNLTVEIADMKAKKKSHMKAYNEELKRLEAERKDLIAKDQQTFDVI